MASCKKSFSTFGRGLDINREIVQALKQTSNTSLFLYWHPLGCIFSDYFSKIQEFNNFQMFSNHSPLIYFCQESWESSIIQFSQCLHSVKLGNKLPLLVIIMCASLYGHTYKLISQNKTGQDLSPGPLDSKPAALPLSYLTIHHPIKIHPIGMAKFFQQ